MNARRLLGFGSAHAVSIYPLLSSLLIASATMFSQQSGASPGNSSDLLFKPSDVHLLEQRSRDSWQKPDQVVESLGLEAGDAVADIGTGSGYFVPRLSRAVGAQGIVYAVDIQSEMLTFVEQKIADLDLSNVATVLSQEDDTRLAPGSVDVALMVDVYHELSSPRALMTNLRRVLKPEGRLAIIDFRRNEESLAVGPPLRHRVVEERLIADLEETGFRLVERETFLPYQYFLIFGDRFPEP